MSKKVLLHNKGIDYTFLIGEIEQGRDITDNVLSSINEDRDNLYRLITLAEYQMLLQLGYVDKDNVYWLHNSNLGAQGGQLKYGGSNIARYVFMLDNNFNIAEDYVVYDGKMIRYHINNSYKTLEEMKEYIKEMYEWEVIDSEEYDMITQSGIFSNGDSYVWLYDGTTKCWNHINEKPTTGKIILIQQDCDINLNEKTEILLDSKNIYHHYNIKYSYEQMGEILVIRDGYRLINPQEFENLKYSGHLKNGLYYVEYNNVLSIEENGYDMVDDGCRYVVLVDKSIKKPIVEQSVDIIAELKDVKERLAKLELIKARELSTDSPNHGISLTDAICYIRQEAKKTGYTIEDCADYLKLTGSWNKG